MMYYSRSLCLWDVSKRYTIYNNSAQHYELEEIKRTLYEFVQN
jgi:hypothetical protein